MFDLINRNHNQSENAYNPFREMEEFEKNFLGDPFESFFRNSDLAEFKTDVLDEGDHYELEADLPGFDKKDIKLELQGDNLVVSAERHSNAEDMNKDGKVVRMERSYVPAARTKKPFASRRSWSSTKISSNSRLP